MAKVTDIGVDMSMERCDKVYHLFTKWFSSRTLQISGSSYGK